MCGVERTPEEAVKLVYGERKKTCGETSSSPDISNVLFPSSRYFSKALHDDQSKYVERSSNFPFF